MGKVNKPSVLNIKQEFSSNFFKVKTSKLLFKKKGEEFEYSYYTVDSPDFVVAIVVKDKKILFVQQYRYACNALSTEFVAGIVDEGYTVVETVVKELKEEAGIVPKGIEYLGSINPMAGLLTNKCHVYFVNDFHEVEPELEGFEKFSSLKSKWISIKKFKKMIKKSKFTDGVSLMSWALVSDRY